MQQRHVLWAAAVALAVATVGGAALLAGDDAPAPSPPAAVPFLGAQPLEGGEALPVVPVNVTGSGIAQGLTTIPLTEHRTLAPFATCAGSAYFEVPDEATLGDGYLRYMAPPFHLPPGPDMTFQGPPAPVPVWYDDLAGKLVTRENFPHGHAAWVTWGKAQAEAAYPWPVVLMRLNESSSVVDAWRVGDEDFVAYSGRAPYNSIACSHVVWTDLAVEGAAPPPDPLTRYGGHVLYNHVSVWDPRQLVVDVGGGNPFARWRDG